MIKKIKLWVTVGVLAYVAGKLTGTWLIEHDMYPWWIAQ